MTNFNNWDSVRDFCEAEQTFHAEITTHISFLQARAAKILKSKLLGEIVDVLKNPETFSFAGTVIDVLYSPNDGILVSVLDQDDNCFDIEPQFVEFEGDAL